VRTAEQLAGDYLYVLTGVSLKNKSSDRRFAELFAKSLLILLIFPETFIVTFVNMFEQHHSTTLTISKHYNTPTVQHVVIEHPREPCSDSSCYRAL